MSELRESRQKSFEEYKKVSEFTLSQLSTTETIYKSLDKDSLIILCGVLLKDLREMIESDLTNMEIINADL